MLLSALLDVPYLAQTPDLCGGAAVAMVMRYWGARDVFPQDFAALVDHTAAGIPTGTLATAVRDKGWQAVILPTTSGTSHTDIRDEIAAGRPLIALIAVAPRVYHYVVIVGVTESDIVVHDPAQAPFRVLGWADFDRAWAATDRWMMLMLPPAHDASLPSPSAARADALTKRSAAAPCEALVEQAIQLAVGGQAGESERLLTTAIEMCPSQPAPYRELAGLRFSQQRWPEAREFADKAIQLDANDPYAWQLLGTIDFVSGRPADALAAWNRSGEPRVDTINVQGVRHTPQPVIVRAAGLEPRELLTPDRRTRAERRLQALPVAESARVAFTPIEGGRATVDVFVDEQARLPHDRWAFGGAAVRAVAQHQVRIDVGGPLDAGDAEFVAWRWSSGRPRVEAGLAIPSPSGLPGVISFDTFWEKQSYLDGGTPASRAPLADTQRHAGLRIADWPTGWFRWSAGAGLDRFNTRAYVALGSSVDLRLNADRVSLSTSGTWWAPAHSGRALSSADLAGAWRSTSDAARPAWSMRAGMTMVSDEAPRALWPGAGSGSGRPMLLRAHALVHDGVIDGPAFGRTLAAVSTTYSHPLDRVFAGAVSVAAFVDAARAWRRMPGLGTSPFYVDAGVGLRVHAPGQRQLIRIDLAHGLRGGGLTLSAGVTMGWPQ